VAAVSQGSIPPPPAVTASPLTASPSPSALSQGSGIVSIAAQVAPTHVSAMSQPVAAGHVPSVEVVDAPRRGAPYWLVAVVGVVGFGLGFAVALFVR
jgi:hypothetical protein